MAGLAAESTKTPENVTSPNAIIFDLTIRKVPQLLAVPVPANDIPPISTPPNEDSTPVLLYVIIPIISICVLAILIITAFNTWKHHRRSKGSKNDCEFVYGEQEPLNPVHKVKGLDLEMQILQESEKITEKKSEDGDKNEKVKTETQPSSEPTHYTTVSTEKEIETTNECKLNLDDMSEEGMVERPKTLKFLAASVAFQYSTVAAVQRLPYTPDPDCRFSVEGVAPNVVNFESGDRLTPLIQPKRKMKPRGLLERRGSNVALTITLRSNDKNNTTSTAVVNTKSPKPLAYLQKASCPLIPEELHEKSCDTLGLQHEFWEIPMNHPSDKDFNVPGHGTKNRYRTILPNEHSRVKLAIEADGDPLASYINANYIRDCTDLPPPLDAKDGDASCPVTGNNAAFIATQGPMTNTVTDFWRMIWQERSASVIMITKLKERKEKCAQYLPLDVGDVTSFDDVTVKVVAMKKYEHFTVRSLEIVRGGETRSLHHFWYTTWMDHETPEKTRGLLELVQEVSIWKKATHGPVVVHCSAGIGRTGCYIAVTVGCQQLMRTGKTNILRLVAQMRLDRGGMIQTWEQYQFVHQALSRYGRILAGENVTTPSTTGSIRSPPDRSARGSITKTQLSIKLPRPQTPKHRRSLSETNLPSPKELKLNLKNAEILCNNEKLQQTQNSESRNGTKIEPLTDESPPNLCSPKSGVVKSASSPSIRSPFGRLCLQAKDMNAAASPLPVDEQNLNDKSNSAKETADLGIMLKTNTNNTPQNGLNFNFQLPNKSPSSTNCNNKSSSPASKKSSKPLFSFSIPSEDSTIAPLNVIENNTSSKEQLSPRSSSKTSPPPNACFFFPGSNER